MTEYQRYREHHKRYRMENPDRYRGYDEHYRIANRELLREKARKAASQRRKANPEKSRESWLRYRAANLEKLRAKGRIWYENHKAEILARRKTRRQADPELDRLKYLKSQYGMSEERYSQLLKEQDGKCAICRQPPPTKYLYVDHNHSGGYTRGLLCRDCNASLGLVDENVDTLRAMIQYLDKWNACLS